MGFSEEQERVERQRSRDWVRNTAKRLQGSGRSGKNFADSYAKELRYEALHRQEAGRRRAHAALMDTVRETSPDGGFWELGIRENHCQVCLGMAGKNHSWDALEKLNPITVHPGCGCRIVWARDGVEWGASPPDQVVGADSLLDQLRRSVELVRRIREKE